MTANRIAAGQRPNRVALLDRIFPPADQPVNLSGRIPALDGVRGLAILIVMVLHFFPHSQGLENLWLQAAPRLGPIASKLLQFGHGVDLFFVLSGFLITGILLDTKGGDGYFRSFYARRTLRILPLYYFVLTVVFLGAPLARWLWQGLPPVFPAAQLYYWAFLGNLRVSVPTPGFNLDHLWSLAVQEQFYLVWPLVVWACSRRRIAVGCVCLIVLAPLTRLLLFYTNIGDYRFATLARADQLAVGGLIALLMRGALGPFGVRARALPWVYVVLPLFAAAVFMPRGWNTEGVRIATYSVVTAAFGLLLVLVVTARPTSALWLIFTSGILKGLGKYSYGLYVFHFLLFPLYQRILPFRTVYGLVPFPLIAIVLSVLLQIVVTVPFGWASWHLYEKQFIKLRKPLH